MSTVQMSVWVPVIAALAGGLVASIAPIVLGLIQSRAEHRRELLRLSTQLAIEDNKAALEKARMARGRVAIAPLSLSLNYHMRLLNLLATGNAISTPEVIELRDQCRALFEALDADAETNPPPGGV